MKRSLLFAALLAMTFGFALFTGCKGGHASDLRVMTFNIRLSPSEDFDGDNCWNNRRAAVIRMIEETKPDLFGIQEGIIHQVNYMEENLPDYARYGVCRDDGLERGEDGKFNAMTPCTRGYVVTYLYRYTTGLELDE